MGYRTMGRSVWGVAILAALVSSVSSMGGGGGVAGEETPQPPADPARRAEIEALVRDLGHSDLARRTAATEQLKRIADEAIWALAAAAESDDPEVRLRATELLDRTAWVPPSVRKRIDALVKTMKTTRDLREGAGALAELQSLGNAGQKALRSLFPQEGGPFSEADVAMEVALPSGTARKVKRVPCKVTFTNKGKSPIWVDAGGFSAAGAGESARGTAGGLMFARILLLGAMGGVPEEGDYRLLHLAPGESITREVVADFSHAKCGVGKVVVLYQSLDSHITLVKTAMGIATPRAVGDMAGEKTSPDQDREVQPVATSGTATASFRLFVLPASLEPADNAPASLRAEILPAVAPEKGRPFRIEVTGKPGKEMVLDGDAFWAALLDGEGNVVEMVQPEWAQRKEPLREGETRTLEGHFSANVAPGEYRLVAFYDICVEVGVRYVEFASGLTPVAIR